jgi:hypothetical protein
LIRDVFIPWIRFGVLEPKEGKEAKGRVHSSRRLLLVRRGAFGVWRWGLMHEDCMEEELALCMGSKELSSSIISWRAFSLEEGAPHSVTVSFLV